MKNLILSAVLFTASLMSFAQVGVNTNTPEGALDVVSSNSGLVVPRVANESAVRNPQGVAVVDGTLIYDEEDDCFKGFANNAWTDCFGAGTAAATPTVTGLTCGSTTLNGTLKENEAATTQTITVPYTGGNGEAYPTGTAINSTSVTGLTATLQAGTLTNAGGNLTYTLAGTATSDGTAIFNITFGGQNCPAVNVTINAEPITIPPTITLAQDNLFMIASVNDDNYLPYTAPAGPATITTGVDPDGFAETLVDVQGVLPTAGITINIPVTATDSGNIPAFTQTISLSAANAEDGRARDLTLAWAQQAYTASTTSIVATLTAVSGDYNAKKLDINAGIGNDGLGVLLGTFTYPYNNAGEMTNYIVRNIAGIPDRNFSDANHRFVYLPVTAADGSIWLNNNLGAHYSNLNHPAFSLTTQAQASNDFNAYGSLIQWGRYSDGHELINWTSTTASDGAEQANETITNSTATTVGHSDFILESSSPYNWYTGASPDNLWQGEAGTNNVCPQGYKVPTKAEWDAVRLTNNTGATVPTNNWGTATNHGNDGSAGALASALKLPVAGYRYSSDGSLNFVGSGGLYWSSKVSGSHARSLTFDSSAALMGTSNRASGYSVRCIKE